MAVEHIQYEYERRSGETLTGASAAKAEPKPKDLDPSLVAWLVLFGFGGGLLALYYANIGYLPQVEWSESLAYLAVMAMAGLFFMLIFSLLLYFPGRIWCRFLICDPSLKDVFFYDESESKPCLRGVLTYIAFPFLLHMIVLHYVLNSGWFEKSASLLLGILSLLCTSGLFWFRLRGTLYPGRKSLADSERRDLYRQTGFFFLSGVASSFGVWVITWLHVPSPSQFRALAVACTVTVLVVNVSVALTHLNDWRSALWAAIAGAFILLILGDLLVAKREFRFSTRMLSHYGVGFDKPVTLIVTEKGCNLLKDQALKKLNCVKGVNAKIEKAEILSRLGSEYFLRVQDRVIELPRTEVLSWSRLDEETSVP